jgi:hypothetical protein
MYFIQTNKLKVSIYFFLIIKTSYHELSLFNMNRQKKLSGGQI